MKQKLCIVLLSCLALAALVSCSREGNTQSDLPDQRELIEHARQRGAVLANLELLADGVEQFHIQLGRFPTNLAEVVRVGYVDEMPPLPEGMVYSYDPVFGHIRVVRFDQQGKRNE